MPNGTRLRHFDDGEEVRMHGWLAARELHHVWMAFVADDGIEHLLYLLQISELLALGTAGRIANRTTQIAIVADLNQRQTGVLLMIAAETAIVRTAPLHRRVVNQRHFRRL